MAFRKGLVIDIVQESITWVTPSPPEEVLFGWYVDYTPMDGPLTDSHYRHPREL